MKIEKISDTQIRCTLNHNDLHARSLSLKELAYGSSKARELFHEMLQKAGEELDFHPEDMPLMVEAIPLSNDGIILNITKIENPDELDPRFSRFAPGITDIEPDHLPGSADSHPSIAADLLESLRSLLGEDELPDTDLSDGPAAADSGKKAGNAEVCPQTHSAEVPAGPVPAVIFCFRTLDLLIRAAAVIGPIYHGSNSLYKDGNEHAYYLTLHRSSHTPEEFNRICNMLTEYGEKLAPTPAAESYYEEHLTLMIRDTALQSLHS